MAALLQWFKRCDGCDWQEQEDYRLSVIFLLQRLTRLDLQKVTAEEKVLQSYTEVHAACWRRG